MYDSNRLYLALTFVILTSLPGYAAELTQRDWMVTLVDTIGWSYGLPDEPQDPDYINILTGNRNFHFEAEDVYAKDEDNVSLMSFRNFGAFSGHGWLNGPRQPTKVHLRLTLPVSGEYQLDAHLRRAGHVFTIGDKTTTVDAGQEFAMVSVGTYQLQAGPQEIVVTLPAGGSLDYITLKAPNLPAITPDHGWQPDEPLDWPTIQTTLLQLLDLAELFPSQLPALTFEAEDLAQTEVRVVSIPHLGHPSGGKWLRAGPLPAEVRFPTTLTEGGFYDLSLRAMGSPIVITIDDHQEINLNAKPYLDNYTFKSLFLFAGNGNITLSLPPGGGVDQLTLTGRQIDTSLVETLLGFSLQGDPITADVDTITSLLAAFGVKR